MTLSRHLVHTASLYKCLEVDSEGNQIFGDEIIIKCLGFKKIVWLPRSAQNNGVNSFQGLEIIVAKDLEANEGDQIIFKNRKYIVEFIDYWSKSFSKNVYAKTLKCKNYGEAN